MSYDHLLERVSKMKDRNDKLVRMFVKTRLKEVLGPQASVEIEKCSPISDGKQYTVSGWFWDGDPKVHFMTTVKMGTPLAYFGKLLGIDLFEVENGERTRVSKNNEFNPRAIARFIHGK